MSNAIGFTAPRASIVRAYLRFLPMVGIGLVAPVLLGMASITIALVGAAVLVFLIGGAYWFTVRFNWLYVSSAGIEGPTATRTRALILWEEEVKLGQRIASPGINCISIQSSSSNITLLLPLPIAATAEFKAALDGMAPSTHPLRVAVLNAN